MSNSTRPLILVTNDDGIHAPGIAALVDAMTGIGDVVVVAPDKPQSGMGHAITVNSTLRIHEVRLAPGIPAYACTGTPVDCVKMAVNHILKRTPDLLVSGINHGPNASVNVLYSGTMSAAIEGAIEGIPSIGYSLLTHDINADFSAAKIVAENIASHILVRKLPAGVCLNVNIPNLHADEIMGTRVCRQAQARWKEQFVLRHDPSGREYFWMSGALHNLDEGDDTDLIALEQNHVSITPVQYDLTAYGCIDELRHWGFDSNFAATKCDSAGHLE